MAVPMTAPPKVPPHHAGQQKQPLVEKMMPQWSWPSVDVTFS
jgi:hypothetical protein